MKWKVEVYDSVEYLDVEADTEKEAKFIAWDWFQEREPKIIVKKQKEVE